MTTYELRDHVQYRFEPNLEDGLFLIYNAATDEFQTGGPVVRDIIREIEAGKRQEEIAAELQTKRGIDRRDALATVEHVCEQFESAGFIDRR